MARSTNYTTNYLELWEQKNIAVIFESFYVSVYVYVCV